MGDAPSPGFSSRVSKTRGRRGLKSKFSQRESLEIAGPDWPDPGVGRNEAVRARGVAAMDSLAAPQDRLVEQLLSPRTQAQRRLKVCVCVCVCVSVRVCRERGGGGIWVMCAVLLSLAPPATTEGGRGSQGRCPLGIGAGNTDPLAGEARYRSL